LAIRDAWVKPMCGVRRPFRAAFPYRAIRSASAFMVRKEAGIAGVPGSKGEFMWAVMPEFVRIADAVVVACLQIAVAAIGPTSAGRILALGRNIRAA
jgi:hypothetical protein